jgi:hypothetical protein
VRHTKAPWAVRSGARLVEPFRGVQRRMDIWRSVLLGVVLAGVLAGCSLGGGSGAGSTSETPPAVSDGQAATNLEADATLRFEQGVLQGWGSSWAHLAGVSCKAAGRRVTCSATTKRGTAVITEIFTVTSSGLVPVCFRAPRGNASAGCFGVGSPTGE